jgi:threonine/homoserine/homoserine lactone efflux protein
MTLESSIALMGVLLVFVSIPGPGVFATTARSLASGFRPALGLILGIVLGDLFFLTIAIVGMAAIGRILGNLFFIIKIIGAGYLIWMGLQLWLNKPRSLEKVPTQRESRPSRNFLAGFTLTLGNPKVILFYLGFLPAFMDLSNLSTVGFVLVVSMVAFTIGTTLTIYAYAAARVRGFFKNTRAVLLLNRGAGTIMVGTGIAVAMEQ